MSPKYFFVLCIFLSQLFIFSQEETKEGGGPSSLSQRDIKGPERHKRYFLESIKDPSKKVSLPSNHISLLINETAQYPDVISRFNLTECYIDTLIGDSISFRIINEEIEVERRNMYSNVTNTYYSGMFAASYRKVNLADIRYINMRSPTRTTLTRVGSVIMTLSILTLVASPFAGMGAEGDEKARKRGEVFIAGISGIAVSIPFFVFGTSKKYGLQAGYGAKNNYWVLKQQN